MLPVLTTLMILWCGTSMLMAEELPEITIKAPKGWTKERFALPPSFAKEMSFHGMEEIRFAPGMYKPDREDFFTYAIAFKLKPETAVDSETIEKELLLYYRGLAKAVSRGTVATDGFKLKVTPLKNEQVQREKDYFAEMNWTEPFVTKKPQTLQLFVRTWTTNSGKQTWMFLCISPQPREHAMWKPLNQMRDTFFRAHLD